MKETIREYSDILLAIMGSVGLLTVIKKLIFAADFAELVNLWLERI